MELMYPPFTIGFCAVKKMTVHMVDLLPLINRDS